MKNVLLDLGDKVFGGFGETDQLPKVELVRAQRRIGLELPMVLTDFYRLVGRNQTVMGAHNRFLAPGALRLERDGVVFLEENQNVMFWSILQDDLRMPDPPVQQGGPEEDAWYPDGRFLSAFLMGTVCWQAAQAMPWTAIGKATKKIVKRLHADLTYADPGVRDKETDLFGFFEAGLVVCVSRSAKKLLVGSVEPGRLDDFEHVYRPGLSAQ